MGILNGYGTENIEDPIKQLQGILKRDKDIIYNLTYKVRRSLELIEQETDLEILKIKLRNILS